MGPVLRFSVIGDAWRMYQRKWWTWSVAMLIVMVSYSLVGSVLFAAFDGKWPGGRGGFHLPVSPRAGALHYMGATLVGGFFLGGMVRMANRQILGQNPRIEDLFSVVDVGFQLAAGSVFYAAATFVAFLLCAIPGFIVSGLLILMIPLIVIARRPATNAFAESWRILGPQWLTATIFQFVLSLVSGMGILFCGVGILFTGPLYSLSVAILFHEFYEPSRPVYSKKPPVDTFPEF
jgi:hypothetical protein